MTNNFTNQALDKAIVPLQLGKTGPFRENWDGSFNPANGYDQANRERWNVLWGVYAFRDADSRPEEGGTQPWAFAEAAMLLTDTMHDFCGGVQASSASVRIELPNSRNSWGERIGDRVTRLCPRLYFSRSLTIPGVTVPILHDALLAERALRHHEVISILQRSLMFWSMSFLYSLGKRGMICMDRAAGYSSWSRDVLYAAPDVTWITNAPIYQDRNAVGSNPAVDLVGEPGRPRPFNLYQFDDTVPRRVDIMAAAENGATWYNYNSGNPVGPVQAFFTTSDSFDHREERETDDDEVEYNEETDEYERVERPIPDHQRVVIPEWYTKAAFTLQHVRMFPRNIFTN